MRAAAHPSPYRGHAVRCSTPATRAHAVLPRLRSPLLTRPRHCPRTQSGRAHTTTPHPYLLPCTPASIFLLSTEASEGRAELDHHPSAGQILPTPSTKIKSPPPKRPSPSQLCPEPLLAAGHDPFGWGLKFPRSRVPRAAAGHPYSRLPGEAANRSFVHDTKQPATSPSSRGSQIPGQEHSRRSTKPRGIPAGDSRPLRFSHQIPLNTCLPRVSICTLPSRFAARQVLMQMLQRSSEPPFL